MPTAQPILPSDRRVGPNWRIERMEDRRPLAKEAAYVAAGQAASSSLREPERLEVDVIDAGCWRTGRTRHPCGRRIGSSGAAYMGSPLRSW